MNAKAAILAAACVALAACQPEPIAETPQSEAMEPVVVMPTEADATGFLDRRAEAIAAKDASALAPLYGADASLFSWTSNDVATTPEARLVAINEFLAQSPTYVPSARTIQILDEDTIVLSELATYDVQRTGGTGWVALRETTVLERQPDGAWLAVASHVSSAPRPLAQRPTALTPTVAPATNEEETPPLGSATPAPAKK